MRAFTVCKLPRPFALHVEHLRLAFLRLEQLLDLYAHPTYGTRRNRQARRTSSVGRLYIYLATDSMPTQGYTGPSTRDIQKTKNAKKTHVSCNFSRSVGRMSTLQASLYIFSGTHIPCGRFSANRIHRTVQVVIYAYLSGQVDSSHVWPNSCRRDGSSITWIICCSTRCMPSGLNLYHKDLAQLLLSVGENLIDL